MVSGQKIRLGMGISRSLAGLGGLGDIFFTSFPGRINLQAARRCQPVSDVRFLRVGDVCRDLLDQR